MGGRDIHLVKMASLLPQAPERRREQKHALGELAYFERFPAI